MMQCCVPTFRRDYLSPASWHIPQKIISAHLVPLLQILPQHNKQEAPFITRFFAGSQPLASKCEPRHVAVAVPNPFLHHRYFGPYYQRYWTQITITVLYCKVTKHTYPAVRKINFFGQSSSFSLHLIQRFVNLLIPAKYNVSDWVWSQSCTAFFSFFFFFLLRHHWRIFVYAMFPLAAHTYRNWIALNQESMVEVGRISDFTHPVISSV